MSIEEVRRINEQGLAAWDAHDADAFVALFGEDIVFYDTALPDPIRDKEGVRQYMRSWLAAFPDMKTARTNAVISEDAVAVELEWTGTNTGPLQGPPGSPPIPATGKKVKGKGAYFARLRDGRIVEFSAHPDVAGLMMQLGIMSGT
ncbi:MAG: ester cyclase [Chloroflexi bacterium]|nr:ester cyclase [Chloroflexota bacterium]